MEQKTGIIYRAYDSQGKSYIGQTTKGLEHRKKVHIKRINDGTKFHRALANNRDDFKWEVLEDNIPEDKLLEREIYWINEFDSQNNGYNAKGVVGCIPRNIPHVMTEEIKQKISNKLKGIKKHPLSEETKQKLREINLGQKRPPEMRKAMSEARKRYFKKLKEESN